MKIQFERIVWMNRWRREKHHRLGDWTLIGVRRFYFSNKEFEYSICFFGLEARFWFKKIYSEEL